MSLGIPDRGLVDADVLRDLTILHEFSRNRRRLIEELLGGGLPVSPVREMLLRVSVIEWGHGRSHPMLWYQKEVHPLAGRTVVRMEILRLESRGVLAIGVTSASRKALFVTPTEKLLIFYSEQMPRLRDVFHELFVT